MKLIEDLRENNSKLHKQQCLKGIEFLDWKTFVYAYNNYFVFNMKFRDFNLNNLGAPTDHMFRILDDILDKKYRGNEAKNVVNKFAKEYGDLIKLIINKDLRCGVTATTFNKVHPDSIAQFKVQLAKEVPIDTLEYPLLAQIKYDGVRLIAINRDGKVTFYTRNGKMPRLPGLAAAIEKAPFVNYILDGEVIYDNGMQRDRLKISGMINSAMHGGVIDETNISFQMFDTMALSKWEANNNHEPYYIRYATLQSIAREIHDPRFDVAVTNIVSDHEMATKLYIGALALGYEGLVLKSNNHLYTFKRTKDWIKVKATKKVNLLCIGWEEGEQGKKYSNAIGGLICEGIVDGKKVTVTVSSGLSDLARSMPPTTTYVHRILEIKYNDVIKDNKTGKYSLFLPRYINVRHDL